MSATLRIGLQRKQKKRQQASSDSWQSMHSFTKALHVLLPSLGQRMFRQNWLYWAFVSQIQFNIVIVIVIRYITKRIFVWTTSNAPGPSVHLGIHSVTCNPHAYSHIGKDSSHITTQSSPAVTHCILAAPQFTYLEGMEGWVNPSAPGIEPGAPLRGERSRRPLNQLSHIVSWLSQFRGH
jgi:hypothetical protein